MKRITVIFVMILAMMALTAMPAFAKGSDHHSFKSTGSGSETSLSPLNCQNTSPNKCTVETNGTAQSSYLGTGPYTSVLTIFWGQATSNGQGGYCAPAAGSTVLVGSGGSQLDMTVKGTVCEVGPTGLGVPHTFTGTYRIIGGTHKYAGASGNGSVAGGDSCTISGCTSFYSASGTIDF